MHVHVHTNGLTEIKSNSLQMSSQIVSDDQTDWDEKPDTALMGYQDSKQTFPILNVPSAAYEAPNQFRNPAIPY